MQDVRRSSRQINIGGLLTLQLAIAPLFLWPFYANFEHRARQTNSAAPIAWLLLPLLFYVAILVFRKLASDSSNSRLVAGVRWGILFGLLFCILAWGPIVVWNLVAQAPEYYRTFAMRTGGRNKGLLLQWLAMDAKRFGVSRAIDYSYIALHYASFGAAMGGIVGVTAQCFRASRGRSVSNIA